MDDNAVEMFHHYGVVLSSSLLMSLKSQTRGASLEDLPGGYVLRASTSWGRGDP